MKRAAMIVGAGVMLAAVNTAAVLLGAPAWLIVGVLSGLVTAGALLAERERQARVELERRLVVKQYKAGLMRRRWLEARDRGTK